MQFEYKKKLFNFDISKKFYPDGNFIIISLSLKNGNRKENCGIGGLSTFEQRYFSYNRLINIEQFNTNNFYYNLKDEINFIYSNLMHEYFRNILKYEDYILLSKNNIYLFDSEDFINTNYKMFEVEINKTILELSFNNVNKEKKVRI